MLSSSKGVNNTCEGKGVNNTCEGKGVNNTCEGKKKRQIVPVLKEYLEKRGFKP